MAKDKGYGLLHRRFFDHPFWQELRVFSKAEAWLDIVFCLTRGTSDSRTGLKRGEFRASLTWLATRWNWDKGKVQRYMVILTAGDDPMIEKTASAAPDIRVYRVCKFERYQNPSGASAERTPDEILSGLAVTPSDTSSDTSGDTPPDTLKPASTLVSSEIHDTSSDTSGDTPPDTPLEEKEKEKESIKEKEKEKEKQNLNSGLKGSAASRTPDTAFEIFAETFADLREPAKYPRTDRGGFVQLAKLRETLSIGTRETPLGWLKACRNYLASPLASFSLADLCVRYGVFVKHGLDRYNKPIGESHGKQPEFENPADTLIRKQKEAGERVRELLRGAAGDRDGSVDPGCSDRHVRARIVGSE